MSRDLDELYLNWLYSHVADPGEPRLTNSWWNLMRTLFTTEFIHLIPNDDNRAADGRYLREEFIEDLGLDDIDPQWLDVGCSMLEMLIGMSRRLAFLGEGEPNGWFWELLRNLGLRYNDKRTFPSGYAEEVLNGVIWRTYKPDGSGGLFPLRNPDRDQREVELWYQMSSYLLERN